MKGGGTMDAPIASLMAKSFCEGYEAQAKKEEEKGIKEMENKVKDVQDYLEKKGLVVAQTSIINAALEIACHRDRLYYFLYVNNIGRRKENPDQADETSKVGEVQEYLANRQIFASEITITNKAIDIAERLGAGKYTFACELELDKKRRA